MNEKNEKPSQSTVKKAPEKKPVVKQGASIASQVKSSKLAPSIKAAIKNIATFGDTDIFPFSFEQHIFHDEPLLIQNALESHPR